MTGATLEEWRHDSPYQSITDPSIDSCLRLLFDFQGVTSWCWLSGNRWSTLIIDNRAVGVSIWKTRAPWNGVKKSPQDVEWTLWRASSSRGCGAEAERKWREQLISNVDMWLDFCLSNSRHNKLRSFNILHSKSHSIMAGFHPGIHPRIHPRIPQKIPHRIPQRIPQLDWLNSTPSAIGHRLKVSHGNCATNRLVIIIDKLRFAKGRRNLLQHANVTGRPIDKKNKMAARSHF